MMRAFHEFRRQCTSSRILAIGTVSLPQVAHTFADEDLQSRSSIAQRRLSSKVVHVVGLPVRLY